MDQNCYIAIDLKSFYASVECRERGLDPMTTALVVADAARTGKTIVLAVTPALKSYGIPGRPRLFEVEQKVAQINAARRMQAPKRNLTGATCHTPDLGLRPDLALDYIVAPPRMAHYIEYSTRIYDIYLKYAAPEDIHPYSIDEVFINAAPYLRGRSPKDFTREILQDVFRTTGITATAGIGPNLYLAKVAMDIVAKRAEPDETGARIAVLDEMRYRQQLWDHRPLTDFWRVGRGYAKKLESYGMYTMGDVARCSLGKPTDCHNEALLYRLFGINAELLIDHAWGREPCTIHDIRSYRPATNSICSGQVLQKAYTTEQARLVIREMADLLVFDLVDKGLVTNQLVLTVGYDVENLTDPQRRRAYSGPIKIDPYGRQIPQHAHGTINLPQHTASTKAITEAVTALYDRIADPHLLVRRLNITANHVLPERDAPKPPPMQLDLFTDYAVQAEQQAQEEQAQARERNMQRAMVQLKKKYGKNAVFKGMNLEEGATALERNRQIGGHKA